MRRVDGAEALIQLREVSVQGRSRDYLPLSVGNAWSYGWANVPETYAAKEVYKVVARQDDLVFIEHYGYVYKREKNSGSAG